VFRAKSVVAGTEWETVVTDIVRVNRAVLHRSAKTGLWSRTSLLPFVGVPSRRSWRKPREANYSV
jgi:hypothetical protein